MKSNTLHLRRAIFFAAFIFGVIGEEWGQTTVTYTIQTGNFNTLNTEKNNNPPYAGTGNNGATEIQQYANGGSFNNTPGAAAFQTFSTTGAGSGTARTLKVGDRFTVTCYVASNPSSGGYIGISFRASTTYTNFFSATDASTVARFQLDNTGNWKVYSGSSVVATSSSGPNADRTFSIEITSSNTFNATIGSETFYDLSFGTAGPISSFSIYTFGDSNANSFWKNGSLTNFGHSAGDGLRFGYGLSGSSSSSISGIVSDGINTNSTGTAVVNVVRVGGSSGTSVALSGASTYTGATTVNANATLKLGASSSTNVSGPLGTNDAGTSITSGGVIDMNGFSLTSSATEGLTINGTGISSGGTLINSSGTGTTWAGTVALGSNSSVGGAGDITLSGAISGSSTSFTKIGDGTLTLSGTNTMTGSWLVNEGTLSVSSFTNNTNSQPVTLGASSTSGKFLYRSTGVGGTTTTVLTVAVGGGSIEQNSTSDLTFSQNATLNGTLTTNCSAIAGNLTFSGVLSGNGGLTVNSTNTGVTILSGANTYIGATTITAGALRLNAAHRISNSSNLVLNGGTFSTGATAGYSETVGTLQLTDNSTIALGTGSHNINFSASNSTAWTAGKTLTITGWTGTASGGTAGRIYVGSSGSALTQAQLDAITFTGAANSGAEILSTGEIIPVYSATITSSSSGNWNSTSTWVGGIVPTSVDNVIIAATHTVTVTSDATCKKINFTGTGGTLTVNSSVTLTVTNAVAVDANANNNSSGTVSGSGTLSCGSVTIGSTITPNAIRTTSLTSTISSFTSSGSLTLYGRISASFTNNSSFNLQSGTFSVASISQATNASGCSTSILMNGVAQTGTLIYTGTTTWSQTGGGSSTTTLSGSGATVNYAATGNQTVLNTSYTNLTLSGSGNKTLAAFSISGTLSIQGSAVGITTAPTFGASSTLEYKNAGNRTTTAIEWPSSSGPANLIIDNSGSTVTMLGSANRTLSGNLTLTGGTLADAGNTLTLQGNIAGAGTQTGAGSIAMTGASKTISGATLGNVTLNNASGFSLSGSPTINGALTFTSGKLSLGANTLNLAGTVASMTTANSIAGSTSSNISITGTGTLGTLLFDQTTVGTTNALNNLTINRSSTGIVNLGSALNLAGNLTVTNGSLRSSGANTLTMAGTTQTLTISNTSGGSVLGTDNSTGNDLTLAIANGSTTTLAGDATSTNDDDKKFFNVTVNTGGTLVLSRGILCKWGTFAVNGTLQINSNGYLQSTPTGGGSAIAPTYGSSSLLKYNSANSYGRGLEWSSTSGIGYPHHVILSNSTSLNVGNGVLDVARQIGGNLTIENGSGFYMDWGTDDMTQAVTVIGNVTINSGGALSLSDASGGGLKVGGNFTNDGTFTPKSRTVELTGSSAQTISGTMNGVTTTNNFYYLTLSNSSGGVSLSTPVVVTHILNLNTGVLTTTSTNILHIINTASSAMLGGNSSSFISGPLRWSVSNGSGGDYKFHLGKSFTYLPFNINNPSGSSPVLTAEAFATSVDVSPAYDNSLSSVSSSEYWLASNTGTLTSGTISLAKGTIGSLNAVASSTTAAGSYSSLGGSAASTLITSNTVTASNTSSSMATPTYFVLATKVPAPTISSFTPSTVYVGTTITITGTDFTNTSAVSIGGVAASSFSVISATSISAVVAASASSGTISVTTPGGTATSSSSFTFSGYVSAAASDWNSTSTWLGGALPPASSAVTIDHAVTVNGTVANNPSSVTINSAKSLTFGTSGVLTATSVTNNGSLIMTAGGTLTIASGGTLANGTNTFTYGAGTVAFAGSGTVTGTIGFNNVTIAGAVNFGTTATMNGILTINAGGAINTNAPSYASGSTLKYNSGNTYGRYLEWNATSGAGYPHHVQVSNNTTLNVTNASHVARQIAGNLTVDAGSTLSMEGMTIASPTEIGLTIGGNILNYGTITVSSSTERIKCVDFTNYSGAITTLSSLSGGDLELTGNFVDDGTYNASTRAIFFTGTGTQNISGSGTFDIDYMVLNKASGEVVMLNNLKCEGPNGGYAITLTNNTDVLNLNGHDIVFGISDVSSSATGSGKLKGDVNSNMTILGTGSFGTLNFDNSYNTIGSLTLNRTSTGSFGLGSNLVVSGTLTLTEGALSIGAYSLECQNAVNVSSGTIKGSSSSTLILSGGNSTAELKMDNTTPGTTNLLNALTLSKTGASSAVNISANVIVNGNLSISGDATNTVNASKQLTVNGDLTNNGVLTLNSGATLVQGSSSNLLGSGTYNVKQDVTGSGGATPNGRFWYLGSPFYESSSSALLSNSNLLWQWNEGGGYTIGYATVSSGQTLTQGRSYVLRSGQNETINFSGTSLSNGTVPISGLTRTGTTQQFRGCHLVSNPYPSYLDWNAITKTNIGTTMYVRTAVNTTYDILETFNSTGSVATNNSGTPLTQYIAPMQGFWVKVTTDGQTGSLTMNNSMRSHQPTGSGLRSTPQDFPAFLRFNMLDGQNKDQVILLMSPDASMSLDNFDSEKMSASGYAQFYSTVNATKLVINGMKNVKAKTSVPLTLVMPTSKSYTFQAEEFNIEDGLILLEDKQEGVIQDLTINPTYSFFGNAGTNATRFVVHFQLASAPVLVGGPQELESLSSEELTTENIQIVSNNQGTVIVRLDEGFKPEGSIRIFDASGRLVEQTDFNDQETTIHLNEQAGMYFVEVSAGKLMVKRKIVIE